MYLKKFYLYSAVSIAIFYLLTSLYMYVFQRSFLYLPNINNHLRSTTLNVAAERLEIASAEGRPGPPWHVSVVVYARGLLLLQRQCHVAELAALDSISKAVAACNSEYASSEGQGDAAAYQTR